MQNKKKILLIITFLFFCIISIQNIALAESGTNFMFNRFDTENNKEIDDVTQNAMGTAIQVVRVAGTGISIIMLSYIGIKYMMAAPNEKAEFKKSAEIYILGAILLFAASNILSIILTFTSSTIITGP